MEIEIEVYKTPSGRCPFDQWFDRIRDSKARVKIYTRLDRVRVGNFGDCKSLKEGIGELRIHYGSGIRIYYAKIGLRVILLLAGGDKSSQKKDINQAKEYLKEYIARGKTYGKK